MNRSRASAISNCEKEFTLEAIQERKRLDGRSVYDYRQVFIKPSPVTHGNVLVTIGETRVQACVGCEVVVPRPQRPTDGLLYFNVLPSPMAAPNYDIGKSSLTMRVERLLDRCFKESRSLDTESLCIIAGQKVWSIRVDIHILNDSGNITDCCVMASFCALKHCRRPYVTVSGEHATIHPVSEREPVPLNIHHTPICITFGFLSEGNYLLVDPSIEEEKVLTGHLYIVMNIHREICTMQLEGVALQHEEVVKCTKIAMTKVNELNKSINKYMGIRTNAKNMDEDGQSILTNVLKETTLQIDNIQTANVQEDRKNGKDIIQEVQEDVYEIMYPMEEEPPVTEEEEPPKTKPRDKDTDEEEEVTVTLTKDDITGLTSIETGLTSNTGEQTSVNRNSNKETSGTRGRKRRKRK
ncbi:PREDICTED: exosome complex component RRP45-like isoform X2 [Amphimedon queenslandica]|uniref:Exosome complex component RRP45 n=1 Tax=Amphimedon queenslandica TaxID=400682 RepID=A0AAN0IW14_AMPQE|nr:PREDICTED: exosome complex component RRP45-like isoform X2 [Amphimedon queenslandica]|eukprot:XP_019848737.1 PREDICTED: exosome complex component RRP45-like isoform X2 [Amphimedon queenslandica]